MRHPFLAQGIFCLALVFTCCSRKINPASAPETASAPSAMPDAEAVFSTILPSPTAYLVAGMIKTPCFGSCPAFEVQIRSDGAVLWRGDRHAPRLGMYRAKASKSWLGSLMKAAEKAGFFQFKNRYPPEGQVIADLPQTITVLNSGAKYWKVENAGDAPPALQRFERFFMKKLETLKWAPIATPTR
jgi:Domain of unknown function (DUF6438)